jgi:hypothetical protein
MMGCMSFSFALAAHHYGRHRLADQSAGDQIRSKASAEAGHKKEEYRGPTPQAWNGRNRDQGS